MKLIINSHSATAIDIDVSVDFIIKRIRSYVATRGWSRTRLAKEAGLPHHTSLRGFEDQNWNPTAAVLRRLEALVPSDFYLAAPDIEVTDHTEETD